MEKTQRAVSREYFLLNSNTEKKRVCQKFVCATLSITFPVVNNALKNYNDFGMYTGIDGRKGQVAWNKLPLEKTNKVKNHINLFPRVESHYCRRDSSKQYFSLDLNISTMYRLYCEQIRTENYMLSPEDQEIPVNINIYRKIFNEYRPKLGFYMPKKDQCTKCNIFKDASEEQQNLLRPEWEQHKEREKEAVDSKTEDKQKAIENKGVNFRSITFDLQAILSLPYAGDSQIYYMRKLSAYNFTIFENPNAHGYCYLWDDINGSKGSFEIGSCLLQYLYFLPDSVSHVSTFSYTCDGQNRNKNVAAAMLYAVNNIEYIYKHLQIIDMKFMDKRKRETKHNIDKSERQTKMVLFREVLFTHDEQIALKGMNKLCNDTNKLFSKHMLSLKNRMEEWAVCCRKNCFTHGHNTNNIIESSIRIFKDIVLERCKAFNAAALVDFVFKNLHHIE